MSFFFNTFFLILQSRLTANINLFNYVCPNFKINKFFPSTTLLRFRKKKRKKNPSTVKNKIPFTQLHFHKSQPIAFAHAHTTSIDDVKFINVKGNAELNFFISTIVFAINFQFVSPFHAFDSIFFIIGKKLKCLT